MVIYWQIDYLLTREYGIKVNISTNVPKVQDKAIINEIHAEPNDVKHQGILPHVWCTEEIHYASLRLVSGFLSKSIL